MNDVRKIAEERAAKPKGDPVGRSFETERQRAKKALVKNTIKVYSKELDALLNQ